MKQSIPNGYCQCGCGGRTKRIEFTEKKRGYIKGRYFKFIQGHNSRIAHPMQNAPNDFWGKVCKGKPTDCWLWQGRVHCIDGYGQMDWEGRTVQAHRLAWELTHGFIPNEMCVLHSCDVRSCCNPSHLFLGDRVINNRDRAKKKRSANGERAGRSKLTDWDVEEIRRLYASGIHTKASISRMFNISHTHVRRIIIYDTRVKPTNPTD